MELNAPDWAALDLDLPVVTRDALAAAWAQDGLDEHASIGAFARFTLQLLVIGAPPDMLEAAQQATSDEIRHARYCFALASAYGEPVAPGPLPLTGDVLGDRSDEAIVEAAVLEGCIGETLAAARAERAASVAVDPIVRQVWAQIAEDEAKHAELAWRFVSWAVTRQPALAHRVVALTGSEPRRAEGRADLMAHGRLSPDVALTCDRQTLETVIRPAARALAARVG